VPSAGFEPVIPATKLAQTYALDRQATGIGIFWVYYSKYKISMEIMKSSVSK
jgi:hypothetical protein